MMTGTLCSVGRRSDIGQRRRILVIRIRQDSSGRGIAVLQTAAIAIVKRVRCRYCASRLSFAVIGNPVPVSALRLRSRWGRSRRKASGEVGRIMAGIAEIWEETGGRRSGRCLG